MITIRENLCKFYKSLKSVELNNKFNKQIDAFFVDLFILSNPIDSKDLIDLQIKTHKDIDNDIKQFGVFISLDKLFDIISLINLIQFDINKIRKIIIELYKMFDVNKIIITYNANTIFVKLCELSNPLPNP